MAGGLLDWAPAPEKDYQKEDGLDLYEYRAFRKVEWRAITRFEARVKEGIAGLFIPDPIQGPEHKAAIAEVERILRLLMDVDALERGQMDIAVISRNLDQQNVPNNKTPSPQVKAQRSRLTSGGASVEFAANSTDKAYWEEPAIQDVRNSVRPQQLRSFQGADGVFIFQKNSLGLTQPCECSSMARSVGLASGHRWRSMKCGPYLRNWAPNNETRKVFERSEQGRLGWQRKHQDSATFGILGILSAGMPGSQNRKTQRAVRPTALRVHDGDLPAPEAEALALLIRFAADGWVERRRHLCPECGD